MLVPMAAALLSVVAFAAITGLEQRAHRSGAAQTTLQRTQRQLAQLQGLPWLASPMTGIPLASSPAAMLASERAIDSSLAQLLRGGAPPELQAVPRVLQSNYTGLNRIFRLGVVNRGWPNKPVTAHLAAAAEGYHQQADAALARASAVYGQRASRAQTQATIGTAAALFLLFGGFSVFFRRSVRARAVAESMAAENARLLVLTSELAMTDALTGLRNRRSLMADAEQKIEAATPEQPLLLISFDLDGFKSYNDTFGHPAGDALLARLASRLESSLLEGAAAYRVGGDEFCLLIESGQVEQIVAHTAAALSEAGDGFSISSSSGHALIPTDAATLAQALHLADERLYTNKRSSRQSASAQARDALVQLLLERDPDLRSHVSAVAAAAGRTAGHLGLAQEEIERVRLAAELHDIGKAAIPDSILNKPGPLDPNEWEFIKQHTLIGERILAAAPALAAIAPLVRSSHERPDGTGYPDGLEGSAIPIGARIVAVADAYDTMVSERPYHQPRSVIAALAELERCAGTQFDPDVVNAFVAVLGQQPEVAPAALAVSA